MRAHSHSHSHPLPLPHPHHAGEHAGLLCGERVAYGSVHSSVCGDAESEGSINSGRSGYLSSHHRPNHEDETDREQFMKMGIQTAVAIGIHKFPGRLRTEKSME
ncbi:hypothetical protein BC937DRAFT_90411 [Endogone sp. FLAS-F59071]|nr:hypothetical protein BC937DRAFT_90411 [Endogone sp. FLAS-F59071]|eukprot:RUS17103.1 hypothetical protein BC937DRAFT_90411 [Endogone sp. FLAS-F59071]